MKFKSILEIFILWRVSLFLIAFFASQLVIFGGRFPYFDKILIPTGLPSWIWGFGNFDGVHYLKIAEEGYKAEYSQAFFPLFPLLIGVLGSIFDNFFNYYLAYFLSGVFLASLFFIFSLSLLYKLFKLDYSEDVTKKSIFLILAFPTSFYFASIYTESTFLFFTLLSLTFMRQKNFLFSGIFILLASATRLIGLMLIPALIFEMYLSLKKGELKNNSTKFTKALIGLLIAPLGVLFYMLYLRFRFENPLYFLTAQPVFGAERSISEIILLPQVIFRYIKILVSVPFNSLTFINAGTEFIFTLFFVGLLVIFSKKLRVSYFIFMLLSILLPTLTGTFSSMPRYILSGVLLFPLITVLSGKLYNHVVAIFIFLQIILLTLFIRGYWVA